MFAHAAEQPDGKEGTATGAERRGKL